jgi:hypothetical protein
VSELHNKFNNLQAALVKNKEQLQSQNITDDLSKTEQKYFEKIEPKPEIDPEQLIVTEKTLDFARDENKRLTSTHELRLKLAIAVFILILFWLAAVMILVFLGSYEISIYKGVCGGINDIGFFDRNITIPDTCELESSKTFLKLPEPIVITLITTTTINVLGLFLIVGRWLFKQSNNEVDGKSR